MKIVKIYGGLGNQMFQYAFARALAAASADEVFIDCSAPGTEAAHNGFELDRIFSIALPPAPTGAAEKLSVRPSGFLNRLRRKYFTKRSHRIDREFRYQPELLALSGDVYFEGYWQSEKYFLGIGEELRCDFTFARALADKNDALLRELPRPIASVHVRRGDYLKYKNLNICTPEYYSRAIRRISSRGGASSYLVFSDDIGYCRATLDFGGAPVAFVDWNRAEASWQDMAMMSRCDCHVIANSSFSWWGAWLDPNPAKRVVAPSIWNRREIRSNDRYYSFSFDDVLPASWERVEI